MSPGSWEISTVRSQRLLLGMIMPPDLGVSLHLCRSMRSLALPPDSIYFPVIGLPFGPARNQAAKYALENGFNLAFWDADVRIEPDAFMKLWATGLDVVSGLYYQRYYPYMPVVFNEGRDAQGNPVKVSIPFTPGDIVPATFIPTGLTIYRHRAVKAGFERWPRLFEWGVDVTPVPSEDGTVPPFSEDFVASWRLKQLGFQPHVATGIVGMHEVRATVGPRWIVPGPSSDPLHGVCGVT